MNKIRVFSALISLVSLTQYAEAAIPKVTARPSRTTIKSNEQLSVSYTLLSGSGRRITQPSGNVSLLSYTDAACSNLSGEIGSAHDLSLSLSKSYDLQPGEYYIKPSMSGYSSSGCQKITVLDQSVPFERLTLSRGAFSQGRYSLELKWESNLGYISGATKSKATVSIYSDEACSQKISNSRTSSISPSNGRSNFSVVRPNLTNVFAKAISGQIASSCLSLPAVSGEACTLSNANIPNAIEVSGNLGSGCVLERCSSNYTKSGNSCSPTVCSTADVSNSGSVSGTKVSGCSASSCVAGYNRVQNSQTQLYSCVANYAPVASDGSVSLNEDSSAQVVLSASDADGDSLAYTVVSQPSHGILSGSGENRTYTPDANYYGSDSFTFKVSDGFANSGTATVTISVNSINDAPVSFGQSVSTEEDTAQSISLSASDIDSFGSLSYSIVSQPAHGVLSGSAPNVTYTPDSNYNGSDSFTFKANDGSLDSNVSTVSITVSSVADAPVISGNINDNLTEDTIAYELAPFSSITTDTDSSSLTWIIVTPPSHGTLSGTEGSAIRYYTPVANYNGYDYFVIKANDGNLDSNLFTVELTVNPVNDAPVSNGQIISTNEDISKEIVLSASDVDLDSLSYIIVSEPTYGFIFISGANVTYTPIANYNGSDSFTFKSNDGTIDSNVSTVSITVNSTNDAPVALSQTVSTNEDSATSIVLSASDVDAGSLLTYSIFSQPEHGILSVSGANVTYTPNLNYNGSDSFTFKANDGSLDSNLATVSITVNPVNDAPVIVGTLDANLDEDSTNYELVNFGSVTADADSSSLTWIVVSPPAHGTLSGVSGSNLRYYTPTENYYGSDSFVIKANDGYLDSNLFTVNLTINPVNDAPVAVNDTISTQYISGSAITIQEQSLLLNDTDIEGSSISVESVSGSSVGSVSRLGSIIEVTNLPANFNGPITFNYTISDGALSSINQGTVSLLVVCPSGYSNSSGVCIQDVIAPSNLSYSGGNSTTYALGSAIVANQPTHAGSPATSWSISPSLPAGLSLNTSTGVISGTPSVVSALTNYTITASNAAGSTTKQISIKVHREFFYQNTFLTQSVTGWYNSPFTLNEHVVDIPVDADYQNLKLKILPVSGSINPYDQSPCQHCVVDDWKFSYPVTYTYDIYGDIDETFYSSEGYVSNPFIYVVFSNGSRVFSNPFDSHVFSGDSNYTETIASIQNTQRVRVYWGLSYSYFGVHVGYQITLTNRPGY